jgi:hypothetical protein
VRALAFVLGVLLVSSVATRGRAQDATADSRAHFTRGVTLYDEGRLPQALAEFREAQRISPSSVILYNIASVEAELGHAVESVAAYEELLATAHTIQDSMRSQIDTALAEQRSRIATLRVVANAPGALIALDDVDIGTAPLESVRVSAGEHVVSARANGYEGVRYRFIVAGGATHVANLTLTLSGAAIGSLRVEGRVPGVEVVVDGVTYGLTPLGSAIALPSGTHHVEGRRPAYTLFAQDVTVAPGSESRVSMLVEPDPSAPDSELGVLRLAVPTASAAIRVDGAAADGTTPQHMTLPAGLHDIDVRVAERDPFTTRVDLVAATTYDLRPPYAWTPEARETRVRAAHGQQDLGWGLLISGGALAIGGAIATIAVWADYEGGQARLVAAFQQNCRDYAVEWNHGTTYRDGCIAGLRGLYTFSSATPTDAEPRALQASFASHLDSYYAAIGISAALAAVGGIALVTGIVLVATAPSEEAIDRGARASTFRLELAGGPSSLTLRGVF